MPDRNEAVLEFLTSRRSRPAKTLTGPVPDRAALDELLTAAARTPDHGKLEPWRFIVLDNADLTQLAKAIGERGTQTGQDPDKLATTQRVYTQSELAVVVVSAPIAAAKVPHVEQVYSAGAVCLALLNAALAAGWGANWLSGWFSHDRAFVQTHLGLSETESVAGLIHIGTASATPSDRPRPDLTTKVQWGLK